MPTTKTLTKHFELLEQIEKEKDPETRKKLCRKDIDLYAACCRDWIREAEDMVKREKETDKICGKKFPAEHYKEMLIKLSKIPHYPSLKTLAILYEKEGNYAEAIKVCKAAIKAGADDDGTKGGMTERLRKLEAKQNA